MISYLGSSNLAKRYIEEHFSDTVADWVTVSEIIATYDVAHREVKIFFSFTVVNFSTNHDSHFFSKPMFNDERSNW